MMPYKMFRTSLKHYDHKVPKYIMKKFGKDFLTFIPGNDEEEKFPNFDRFETIDGKIYYTGKYGITLQQESDKVILRYINYNFVIRNEIFWIYPGPFPPKIPTKNGYKIYYQGIKGEDKRNINNIRLIHELLRKEKFKFSKSQIRKVVGVYHINKHGNKILVKLLFKDGSSFTNPKFKFEHHPIPDMNRCWEISESEYGHNS